MGWVKRLADHVIQDRMGQADLEFSWSDLRVIEPKEQADILAIYVKEGIETGNEARGVWGDDPLPGGDALMVDAAHGPVALEAAARVAKAGFNPDEARVPGGNPSAGEWTGDAGGGESAGTSGAGNATNTGAGDSEPRDANSGRVWERFPNADFRNRLAIAEQTPAKPNFGYGEANPPS